MKEDKDLIWSAKEQQAWKSKIRKLGWLEERFGDKALYQGFDQGEVMSEMIQVVISLRLTIIAKSHQSEGDNT